MRLDSKVFGSRQPAALWLSSGVFSLLVLILHRSLDQLPVFLLLTAVGLCHVGIAVSREPPLTRTLFLSQALTTIITAGAILLYVLYYVGWPNTALLTLRDFIVANTRDSQAYLNLFFYCVFWLIGAAAVAWVIGLILGRKLDRATIASAFCAASTVNIACDYTLRRPLFHAGGNPENIGFFFAAGIFGVELSLPLNFIILTICACWYFRGRGRDRQTKSTS